jgi:hypothetical protein
VTFPEQLKILFVLVVPRDGTAESGRYESPEYLGIDEASALLSEFSEFFECDGRHHVWIACPGHGNIVFDRHNVVYGCRMTMLSSGVDLLQGDTLIRVGKWRGRVSKQLTASDRLLSRTQMF